MPGITGKVGLGVQNEAGQRLAPPGKPVHIYLHIHILSLYQSTASFIHCDFAYIFGLKVNPGLLLLYFTQSVSITAHLPE